MTLPTELLPHFYNLSLIKEHILPAEIPWAGEDSNLRRHEPSDLQSDAFDRFATCPTTLLEAVLNYIRLLLSISPADNPASQDDSPIISTISLCSELAIGLEPMTC